YPESTALVCNGERLSFRELEVMSNAFANALIERGLTPGQRVYIALATGFEWPIALFGVFRAGGVAIAANPRWNAEETRHATDLAEPSLFISDATSRAAAEASGLPVLTVDSGHTGSFWRELRAASPEAPVPVERDWKLDEAMLFFSSGTTGLPKAVRHSHYSLGASVINWKSAIALQFPDKQQFTLPLFTGLGASTIIGSAMGGVALYLTPATDVDVMLAEIESEKITHSMLVAPVALRIARHPDVEKFDLSSLRVLVWCATAVNASVAEEVTRRTGVHWVVGYGMTEVLGLTCNPAEYPELCRLDSVGPPRSDGELRIIDIETLQDVPDGEEGEVIARSPALMLGYLPESANAGVFLDGWIRTGDVGRLDEDGWLILTDRIKDLIKVSGLQVAPAEVESALLEHPAVRDCAVVGAPDENTGEKPVAYVVASAPVDECEILDWMAGKLSTYKRPSRVFLVDEIPRTASGKTLRRDLRTDAAMRIEIEAATAH
ncbi:MAG: AMP-dependent synthetase and ligase, partial [Microbacteriaceae bacterium]|nr:AMP-dependent synthetase and ligase [Microbacteriaceae bacterium]